THQRTLARIFGLERERVRVVAPHVGGGFGAKGTPRPNSVLAAMAAREVGRPVKFAVPRQQMYATTGYRTPTVQRMRLGADADGRLNAIVHDVVEQTSTVREFAEQTAAPTRIMYRAPHRRTTHRVVRPDVPTPSWMRAPGETPGTSALESVMDGLAVAAGSGPGELRVRDGPRRAARRQRARPGAGERPAVQLPQPRRVPGGGRREVRLGGPRPGAAVAPGRPEAARDGRRGRHLPGAPQPGAGGGAGRAGRDV